MIINKKIFLKVVNKGLDLIPFSILLQIQRHKLFLPFYHIVSNKRLPHVINLFSYKNVEQFENDIDFLIKYFSPLTFDDLIRLNRNESKLLKKSFLLSFDDGYREVYEVIAPILKKRSLPAIFFVNSAFIDNKEMFFRNKVSLLIEKINEENDSNISKKIKEILLLYNKDSSDIKKSILSVEYQEKFILDNIAEILNLDFDYYLKDKRPYLTSDEISSMIKDGFTFGAHSVDHPLFENLTLDEQLRQTRESLNFIKNKFNIPYSIFAFPFNDNDVSDEYFRNIFLKDKIDITFGTSDFEKRNFKSNIQRQSMERSLEPLSNIYFNLFKNGIVKKEDIILKILKDRFKNSLLNIKIFFKYYFVFRKNATNKIGEKIVYIDITDLPLTRYLYLFIKFFDISGYTVFLPKKIKIIRSLLNNEGEKFYSSLIIVEKRVRFGKPPKGRKILNIKNEILSVDYFNELFIDNKNNKTYHVPIPQHPLMYHKNLWNIIIDSHVERKQSIFMAGDFDNIYKTISKEYIFDVFDRITILSFLESDDRYYDVKTQNELNKFLQSPLDKKIIFVKKSNFVISMEILRNTLNKFDFFFALPGFIIPFSHNIIEAMSVGCIPVIQDTYASLFRPILINNFNAITFKDLTELKNRIDEIFNYTKEEILYLRNNVANYYSQYLVPNKIVGMIESNNFEKIYLLAEEVSVNKIKLNRINATKSLEPINF